VEYQQYELFSDLLDEIEVNPLDHGALPLFRFVEKLNYSLSQRIFQPQTEASPLQVMFLRDTFGLSFQVSRVVGAVAESLPAAPQALSLIPWQICHDHNIRSVFESEPEVIARRLLGRLNEQAPTLLSFTQISDGLEALPSRFCAAPNPMPQTQSPLHMASRGTVEEILDDRGFEIAKPMAQTGGVGLLEDQALCPLKAHLKHRLDISSLREAQTGLSAAERGALLHSALFYTFDELSNSEKLLTIGLSEQAAAVGRAVNSAITNIRSSTRDRVGLNVIDLERERLQTSVANWLELERKREIPFEVIERETSYQWQSQGLTLSFKVDRVDELADGGRLVIDYKSKATNTLRDWIDNPIKAPQLPCYSEVIDDVVAVAIASVTSENAGYRPLGTAIGVGRGDQSSRKELEENANLSWAQLRDQWRIELDRLVAGFIAGDAKATPSAKACRYCDFASICRAKISAHVEDGTGDIEGALGD
jgi:probable DNA repair protein